MNQQFNFLRLPIEMAQAGVGMMNAMMQALAQGTQFAPNTRPLTAAGGVVKRPATVDNPSMRYFRALQARSVDQVNAILAPDCIATGPFAAFSRTTTNEQFSAVLRDNIWPITTSYNFRGLVRGENEGVLIYNWITKVADHPIRIAVHQTYSGGRIKTVELFFDPSPVVQAQRKAKK